MKSIKTILIALMVLVALPASAQFRFGVRLGTEVNSVRLDKSVFNNDNRAGFTGGLMCEFTVPIIGVGFDLSAMYVHRVGDSSPKNTGNADNDVLVNSSRFKNRDYIEIPLNLKYKLSLPVVSKILVPYITTGPSVSFLTSKRAISEAYKNKAVDVAWNFGLGLQFFNHLQVSASYGIGLNKTVEALSSLNTTPIEGKNNYWTITAAWLF
ncbi:MAG: PorT family protein [Muribaculum sp.]|nr:PorT family protein [Muribaculum sp.]